MKDLKQIQREKKQLEEQEWRINHLKELAKDDVIYTPRPLRKHEKLFLKNFDKMGIEELCKVTKLGKTQIYNYFKQFDNCVSRLSVNKK